MKKKRLILFLSLLTSSIYSQKSIRTIYGTITDGNNPISDVNVSVKGSDQGTSTNSMGNFNIAVRPKDILSFSFLGMETKEIRIKRRTERLDIILQPVSEVLDEVVLKKRKRQTYKELELEYDTNKELIRSAYGILDRRRTGYSMRIIDEENFSPGQTFIDAIQGRFIGRVVYPSGSKFLDPVIYLRETPTLLGGSTAAIYDVDGAITYDAPVFMPMSDIKRIAIIRGLGAVSRYGSNAQGGVIIINTKQGKRPKTKLGVEYKSLEAYRAAAVKDNFCTITHKKEVLSAALSELASSSTEQQALKVLEKLKNEIGISPYDRIAVGSYFMTRWGNRSKAFIVWDNLKKEYADNARILKALAFKYEESGNLESALGIYQKIASIRPAYAQTYRDLGSLYSKMGKPEMGLKIYAQYLQREPDSFSPVEDGIDYMMNIEALSIIKMNDMKFKGIDGNLPKILEDSSLRLVLEWNTGDAEFDIQWKNSHGELYIWQHSQKENSQQMKDEQSRGYSSRQFFISENPGEAWTINIKYYGNKSDAPTYLKATGYQNYGTSSQKEEVKAFSLSEENSCLTLFSNKD